MKNLKDIIESQNFLVNKKLNNRQKLHNYEYFPETKKELNREEYLGIINKNFKYLMERLN